MIIAGSDNKGKKLLGKTLTQLNKNGSVEVAALSVRGIERIQKLGQQIANATGRKINAVPNPTEIDGREALVITLTFE